MRIYYRGPDVIVTGDNFVHRTPTATRTFLVRDLHEVCISQVRPFPRHSALLFGAAAPALVAVVPLWRAAPHYAAGFLVLLSLIAGSAAVFLRGRPRPQVLEAMYHGQPATLYESLDSRVFNQVSRALRRAVEDSRPHSAADDDHYAA